MSGRARTIARQLRERFRHGQGRFRQHDVLGDQMSVEIARRRPPDALGDEGGMMVAEELTWTCGGHDMAAPVEDHDAVDRLDQPVQPVVDDEAGAAGLGEKGAQPIRGLA
ncbi:hypothetical protein VSX64_23525 [Aurantimonas sp. C2-6-R+9]|uniref:hypothetical protein n=1 Tax=Aurantimonas sp. C2-6-R+9 TaxID=3114365 RepID=UPI002E1786F2|nr:hypothetical protein [Aurantimonas sp. C2-6-R+9]